MFLNDLFVSFDLFDGKFLELLVPQKYPLELQILRIALFDHFDNFDVFLDIKILLFLLIQKQLGTFRLVQKLLN